MHTHVKLRDSGNPPGLEGSTIVLAGCGIWLFFEVILGSELKKGAGSRNFDNEWERDFIFLLG